MPRRLPDTNFDTLTRLAGKRLPPAVFAELRGVGRAMTAARNAAAFDAITFNARSGRAVETPSVRVSALGTPLSMPVILAPVGGLRMIHPDGGPGSARAAVAAGTIASVSMVCGHTPEEIGANLNGTYWQQIYMSHGRSRVESVIDAAKTNGASAIVVTVDCATSPKERMALGVTRENVVLYGPQVVRRPRWLARFLLDGAGLNAAQDALEPTQTVFHASWEDLEWISARWNGPLVVKGVLTVDDALRAVDAGAHAVVVSNHGGLALDGLPASLDRLASIATALEGRGVEIYFDGGIRSGGDVVKALALGAKAVMVGRYYTLALAAAGERGAQQALEELGRDVARTLVMLGCDDLAKLDASYLSLPS